jgi:hypothetical protein
MKKDEMNSACSTHGDIVDGCASLAEYYKIRNDLEEQYIDVKIILKCNLEKYDVRGGLDSAGSWCYSVRCCSVSV